ncbi:response regulator [Paludisphaera borealis]|uniref:Response regulator receiver protein n=1 Tax=Paludisphaera borealis TaxID=1387353 RepID=A0A1U7CNI9_9BACT|nr:response regulator [Paludisphaera borealis]APW60502.1 Response regulator receiver protein [Paludisphaera borealis]
MIDHPPSILIVDDDEDICENMADIFTDLGFDIDVAHEGRTALELVRGRPYDVVLLDLKMPGMDGLSLYREIKKVQAGTVAFLLTAYAGGSTAGEALAAGASQVLAKPVDLPLLLRLIDEALDRPLVLVVDDDDDLCLNLWDLLREQGYRVCIAHDGRQAVERLRTSTRVVLIDLNLPDRDGADVCRQVRESNPASQVVLITGHRAELEPKIERLQAEGFDAICYKPFDLPELLGTLERLAQP